MWTNVSRATHPHDSPQQGAPALPLGAPDLAGTGGAPALRGGEAEQPGSPEIDACVTAKKEQMFSEQQIHRRRGGRGGGEGQSGSAFWRRNAAAGWECAAGGRGGEGSPWEAPGSRPELHSAPWAAGLEGEGVKGRFPV